MSDIISYFAYGSNLHPDRLKERLGWLPPARQAYLHGHRLLFNKRSIRGGVCANITPDRHHVVWGVIYECTPDDVEILDCYEGVGGGHYKRQDIEVHISQPSAAVLAMTYVAGDQFIVPEAKPLPAYFWHIWQGAHAHGLPADYLNYLARFAQDATVKQTVS